MNKKIENEFCQCLGSDNVNVCEPMKKHTTFRIGGPAEYYLRPHSVDELRKIYISVKGRICRFSFWAMEVICL